MYSTYMYAGLKFKGQKVKFLQFEVIALNAITLIAQQLSFSQLTVTVHVLNCCKNVTDFIFVGILTFGNGRLQVTGSSMFKVFLVLNKGFVGEFFTYYVSRKQLQ